MGFTQINPKLQMAANHHAPALLHSAFRNPQSEIVRLLFLGFGFLNKVLGDCGFFRLQSKLQCLFKSF